MADPVNKWVAERRVRSGDATLPQGGDEIWGLAMSGGGIRSATFCFGLLRALAKYGALPRLDVLSTVSGGGYIGAAVGRLFDAVLWPWPVRVSTLGSFTLRVDGQELEFTRKAPKKPIAVLKALIAMGGRDVLQHRLLDALWSDEDGDAAEGAFDMCVHRLRKLLGTAAAVLVQDSKLGLNPEHCFLDTWAFERLSDQAEAATTAEQRIRLTEQALALYRGPFLQADAEEPWSVSLRERLRARFIRHVSWLAWQHVDAGRWPRALECYQRGIDADDLAEEFYQGAMQCYRAQDRNAEGLAMYRRLRQVLSVALGVTPSQASHDMYRALLGQ